jgi:Lon-like ATP-dependent protease
VGGAGGGESGSSSGSGGSDGGRRARRASAERGITKPTVPDVYPQVMAIPIAKRPLFPGFYKAVTIRDPNVSAAITEMIKRGQPYVGAFLFKDDTATDKDVIDTMDDVHEVGVFAQVTSAFPVHGEEHSITAVLYPHRRIKMSALMPPVRDQPQDQGPSIVEMKEVKVVKEEKPQTDGTTENKGDVVASFEEPSKEQASQLAHYEPTAFLRKLPVSLANIENLTEAPHDKKSDTIKALTGEIVNVFKEVAGINPLFRDQISDFSVSQSAGNVIEEPAKLADFAAAVSAGEIEELQDVLQTMNVEERLHKALVVLKKELMNAKLQSKISKDVESKIQKRQREYWLMEQMKGIRRELGIESDGKDKLVEKFREKAQALAMPEAVKKVFDEELNKLAHLEPAASEFNVARNYLDWITQIPWGQRSAENFGIKNAMTVLDEDHYGLKDVKDRILEFIAVGKLRGTVEGKILCFVGPPGVGKTSIGKSIARALNRQYYRFSVGGLTDVAEIKGHRRTYVGALPGRIIQALKKCQTENPLILIDEVDKIGRGHQGDPSSALLELLDPEQNNSFLDHYMDIPVDLSGYVADEKKAIAERYLGPQAKELSGLKDVDVSLTESAIEELINKYCRESGVRNLKKQIEKVYRKSALKIIQDLGEEALPESEALTPEGAAALAESKKDSSDVIDTPEAIANETTEKPRVALKVPDSVHVEITRENLKDYVGPPVFTSDRLYDVTPPGVAMGLAWTSMGGAALYVESILESALSHSSRPALERTGNLKPVMKESTTIAYSFAKSLLANKFPENRFFDHARIHLHCPEGAVQKDGPSAGITMATSLLSLALGKSIDTTVAMTGELTVTGKVLRIGGLREKTVAARRAGATKILFPRDNWGDWCELPEVSS